MNSNDKDLLSGGSMKKFFHDYSYSIVKMFINQFAIAIFGTSLAFATTHAHLESAGFDTFTLIVSIFAMMFYLFLIYTLVWEIGAKDRISVDVGKKIYRPHLGLILSLLANIPNFILAILYLISSLLNFSDMMFLVGLIASLVQGMYFGAMISIKLPLGSAGEYVALNTLWPTFFIIIIPSLLACWCGYYFGYKNFKIFSLFVPEKQKEEAPKIKK